MGLTGIPIFNVNNNCATGSSALFMGNQLIAGGIADCVLALGFEKMQRGSLSSQVLPKAALLPTSFSRYFSSLMIEPIH